MKSNNKFLIIIFFSLFITNSCSDELEIVDPNRLSSSQYYQTEDQAIAAVNAMYNALIVDGMYQRITPIYNDGRGDEISCRSPWSFMTGFSTFTITSTGGPLEIFWAGHYILISRANQVLENVIKVPNLDETLKNRLLGQAYFLRALAYFNLANVHDKVPLILTTPKGSENFYPSNADSDKTKVYAQVKEDLAKAITSLPADYKDVTGPDKGQDGRATKGAGQSLLGTVHLYEGNYAAALPFFRDVINSNEYSLAANYTDLFTQDPAIESSNPGRIFWADFTTSTNSDFNWGGDPNVNWRQFIALTPTYSVGDFFDFYPTKFLYDEMRKEKTVDGKLDPRYHSTILSYEPTEGYTTAYGKTWQEKGFKDTDYFIKKFTNAVGGTDAFSSGFNYHILRYEDVLLMYAECLANTGNIGEAAKYVQIVRSRANLPNRQVEFAAFTLPQFMQQIEHERIMELSIEGKRWYDLKRWGFLDNAAKLEELKLHDFEFSTFNKAKEYIPIPQLELDRNPNLVGNSAN
jgi:starch-binding outer membrane protein, SusD/RagB family